MRYLSQRKNGIWYFRYQVPPKYRSLFEGRKEIKKSLATVNRREARLLALQHELKIQERILRKDDSVVPSNWGEITTSERYRVNTVDRINPPKLAKTKAVNIDMVLELYAVEKSNLGTNRKTIEATVYSCKTLHMLIRNKNASDISRAEANKALELIQKAICH